MGQRSSIKLTLVKGNYLPRACFVEACDQIRRDGLGSTGSVGSVGGQGETPHEGEKRHTTYGWTTYGRCY